MENTAAVVDNNSLLEVPVEQESLQALEKKLLSAAQSAREMLAAREQALTNSLTKAEHFVDTCIQDIQTQVSHVKAILDGASVNTWRVQAETTYKAGKEQADALQAAYGDIQKSLKESCTRLNQASIQVVKGVSKVLGNLHPHAMQELVDQCADEVKNTSELAAQQMTTVVGWFHWKNLVLVFFLSTLVTLSIGLFTNAEWPWEVHSAVVKERVAGQALLDTWYRLSQNDQQLVVNDMTAHSATG